MLFYPQITSAMLMKCKSSSLGWSVKVIADANHMGCWQNMSLILDTVCLCLLSRPYIAILFQCKITNQTNAVKCETTKL